MQNIAMLTPLRDRRAVLPWVLILAAHLAASPVSAQGVFWWRNAEIRDALSLTKVQVERLERAYNETLEERRRVRRQLDKADAAVADAVARGSLTDDEATMLIDRAETLRSRRNVARALLLFRMHRLLTHEQRLRLERLDALSSSRAGRTGR